MRKQFTQPRNLFLEAHPGTCISDCLAEAIINALELDVKVEIAHNGRIYTADPASILSLVGGNQREGE